MRSAPGNCAEIRPDPGVLRPMLHEFFDRPRRFWLSAAGIVAVLILSGMLIKETGRYFRLGVDLQVTPSLPWRLYSIRPFSGTVQGGDILAFRTPKIALSTNGEAAKIVVGLPGDHVRVTHKEMFINEAYAASLWLCPSGNRPDFCADRDYVIPPNEYVVLGTDEHSFDSRYWNTLRFDEITGRVYPLLK